MQWSTRDTHPLAHPSPLLTIHRPTRLHGATIHRPTHLHCSLSTGPPISMGQPSTGLPVSMGQPSTGPPISMGQPSTGPPVCITHHAPAHPSPWNNCPPAHPSVLHPVHWPKSLGPSISIIYSIHYQYLVIHSYTTLYYIPLAHPFPSGTHYTPAHSSILLQFPTWAHMGWPVCLGTLSTSAGCPRRVSSLEGLQGRHQLLSGLSQWYYVGKRG